MKPFDPESGNFVRTSTESPLTPAEPNDYIVNFSSELRRYVHEDEGDIGEIAAGELDPSLRVATLDWAILNFNAAVEDKVPLFDVMDADSEEMVWVHETITTTEPEEHFGNELVFESWGNVVYFRTFEVEPGYEVRDVARALIDHVLRFYGAAAGAVFIFGINDQPQVRDAFTDCGFEVVRRKDDMEFLTLDLALRRPEPADRTNVRPLRRPKPIREE